MTTIGAVFGIEIGREKKKRGIITATIFAIIVLFSFISAKSFQYSGMKSSLCHFVPQLAILLFSLLYLQKIMRGSE